MKYDLVLQELYKVTVEYKNEYRWRGKVILCVAVYDNPDYINEFVKKWFEDIKEEQGWVSYQILDTEFIYDSFWSPTPDAHRSIEV